jgi:hypothetical protein
MDFLGYVKDIEFTKRVGQAWSVGEDFYPISHLLVALVSGITSLDARHVIMAGPSVLFACYALGMISLAEKLAPGPTGTVVIAGMSSAPVLGWFQGLMTPGLYTFSLIPFLLLLNHRASAFSGGANQFLLLFLLVLLPFSHPIDGGPFLAVFLLCIFLGGLLARTVEQKGSNLSAAHWDRPRHMPLLAIAVFIGLWFLWVSPFRAFQQTLHHASGVFQVSGSEAMRLWAWFEGDRLPLRDSLPALLLEYVPTLVYGVLGSFAIWRVAQKLFDRLAEVHGYAIGTSLTFVVFAVAAPASLLSGFEIGHFRSLPFLVLSASVAAGLVAPELIRPLRKSSSATCFLLVAIVTGILAGILTVHRSPLVKMMNPQVSFMDFAGAGWLFTHDDEDLLIDQIAFVQRPFVVGLFGEQNWPRNVRTISGEAEKPPAHFGYDLGRKYGEAYKASRYFVNDTLSRIWYEEGLGPHFRAFWRWTSTDFARLEIDTTVNRLYANGEFDVYLVTAAAQGDH